MAILSQKTNYTICCWCFCVLALFHGFVAKLEAYCVVSSGLSCVESVVAHLPEGKRWGRRWEERS